MKQNQKIEENNLRTKKEIQEMIHYYIRRLYEESDMKKSKFFEGNIFALLWVLKR